MNTNLKALIGKLNPVTRGAMESAANVALSSTHHEVDIEHVLLALLDKTDSDMAAILRAHHIDAAQLEKALHHSLSTFRTGNTRRPVLSENIPKWLQSAWLCASVNYGAMQLRSGFLLWALIADEKLARIVESTCPQLRKLSIEKLQDSLPDILRLSKEAANTPFNVVEDIGNIGNIGNTQTVAEILPTPALDKYTVNLTAQARAGKIDPVIGRDAEVRQMIDILLRRRQNNPILTGEPGVGKTAVVEGLASRIVQGDVPEVLKNVTLRTLDLGLLQAGASVKGEFENRLRAVIDEVKASLTPVILFIDEAHTMIGAGGNAGQNDAANLLKPALARGELRTIAATTWAEYKKYFEKDAALARRFQVVKIEEPSEEVAMQMLRGIVSAMEQHHQVRIMDEAVVDAVKLSSRYLAERQLPDKAISVLDTACARVSLSRPSAPVTMEVKGANIAEVISGWTGIPLGRMAADEIDTVRNLKNLLEQRVVGQPHALASIAQRIQIAKASLEDPSKPQGVFLLVGPSGVGKTETALALAETLYGGERNLITINMSEYQESHSVSGLKGSPPGYVGYGEGGVLTEAVRRKPYSVILLDEVEKAHPDVLELFFQVFDKGVLEDAEGRVIDFKNTIILLTSNVGTGLVMQAVEHGVTVEGKQRAPTPEDLLELLRDDLQKAFKPAFLGRLSVIPYYPIEDGIMRMIVGLKLDKVKQRIFANHGAALTYDDKLIKMIVSRCTEVDSGARDADAMISKTVLSHISNEVLTRMAQGLQIETIALKVKKDQLTVLVN